SGVFVGAYDQSGHLAGYSLTDLDVFSGKRVTTDGTFEIRGLQEGAYYVRTVALFMAINLLTELTSFVDSFENLDIMSLLFGGGLTGLSFDLTMYKDMWYPEVPATITISLDELLFQASAYGRPHETDNAITPIFLPLPFYEAIPKNAQPILVSNNAATDVKFVLAEGDVSDLVTGVHESKTTESLNFVLNQNYPNPFNPATTLSFSLGRAENVRITLYDILGKQIRMLTDQIYLPGNHSLIWDGKNNRGELCSAGVYIASVSTGTARRTIRLLLMK
ncbi:MAG: T9SS C-terminal target domain-containing protein, partial [Calditrichaeota bacterium]